MAQNVISHSQKGQNLFGSNKVEDDNNILNKPVKPTPFYAMICFKKGVELETDKKMNKSH